VLFLLHKSLIKINRLWLNPNSFFGGSSLISLCWLQTTHYVVIQTASEWCQWILIISPSKARNIYYSCGMPSISLADQGSVTPTSHLNSFLGLQGIVSKTLLSWTILWQKDTPLVLRSGSIRLAIIFKTHSLWWFFLVSILCKVFQYREWNFINCQIVQVNTLPCNYCFQNNKALGVFEGIFFKTSWTWRLLLYSFVFVPWIASFFF